MFETVDTDTGKEDPKQSKCEIDYFGN